jgi:hypothetical protein
MVFTRSHQNADCENPEQVNRYIQILKYLKKEVYKTWAVCGKLEEPPEQFKLVLVSTTDLIHDTALASFNNISESEKSKNSKCSFHTLIKRGFKFPDRDGESFNLL